MEHSDITSSELLHSFVEGELDANLEPTLFAELNSSTELRSEMRDLLAMQRAVKRDRAAIVPPIASTAAVFGALGMSTSLLVSEGWLSALWSKIWAPLAAAAVGGAVTWYAVSPGAAQSSVPATAQTAASIEVPGASVAANAVIVHDTVVVVKTQRVVERVPVAADRLTPAVVAPVASTVASTVASPLANHDVADHHSSAASGTTANSLPEAAKQSTASQSSLAVAPEVLESGVSQTRPASITIRRSEPESTPLPEVVNGTRELPGKTFMPRSFARTFSASLRSISAASTVDVAAAAANDGGLNNLALSVFYTFNDWFGAGVEIGREPFAMSFRGISDGNLMRYESTQNLLWGSAQAQLYPFPSLREHGWQPFFQFNGGFTNYGFLGKGLFGTTYAPTTNLRMMFGFETTGLFYNVQGTSYTTPKLGITYGIGYQL
ncbi:MAG: hypothetical protein RL156_91 [Bacteroidota bacterium]